MSHTSKFRKTFKIDARADFGRTAVAIEAVHTAGEMGIDYLKNVDPQNAAAGFRIHSLINLLGRVFEHAQAMLVALSTGSPSSSEALARIVVEGSINIIYLATLGDAATLLKFFRVWTNEHVRKLAELNAEVEGKSYADRVRAMIEERRQLVVGLERFISEVETQCSIVVMPSTADWHKSIFKRFEALGRQTDYYESYHRLSGASHLTGEDTLMWLLALQAPGQHLYRIGKEAWAYSTMMSRIASTFFVDAIIACVISYGRINNEDLAMCQRSLWKSIGEIAKEAGVPEAGRSGA